MLHGGAAQYRLAAPNKAVQPEERLIPLQSCGKHWTLHQPLSRPGVTFCIRSIVLDSRIWGSQPLTHSSCEVLRLHVLDDVSHLLDITLRVLMFL